MMGGFKDTLKKASAVISNGTRPKFSGTGHKLGSGEEGKQEPSRPQPSATDAAQHNAGASGAAAAARARPMPAKRATPHPLGIAEKAADVHAARQQPEASTSQHRTDATITEDMQVAAATLASAGDAAVAASELLRKLLQNVVKFPDEAKYRQMKRSNARIASMLAAPGAEDMLLCVGFEAATLGDDEVLLMPADAPRAVSLAAGALQLLQCVGQANASPLPDVSPEPHARPQVAQATLETSDTGDRAVESSQPALAAVRPAAAEAAEESLQQLGVSPAQWRAENGQRNVVSVGGVHVSGSQPTRTAPTVATANLPNSDRDSPDPFVGRNTQVLLPVAADVTVSDEVFKRSGGELQRDWQRARERREQGEVLMTRATREKLAAKKKRHHCFARVRVRFPEGIILQGAFEAGEELQIIHTWVEEHLRAPMPFALASPALVTRDKRLPQQGTVKGAGLMPSVLLNFRWTDKPHEDAHPLCLSDAAMAQLRTEAA